MPPILVPAIELIELNATYPQPEMKGKHGRRPRRSEVGIYLILQRRENGPELPLRGTLKLVDM